MSTLNFTAISITDSAQVGNFINYENAEFEHENGVRYTRTQLDQQKIPAKHIRKVHIPVAAAPVAAAKPAPTTTASAGVEVTAVGGPIVEYGLQMAKRGIRVHPLWPKTKLPILSEWENKATTDEKTIRQWAAQYPNCNYGCVAYSDDPDGIWLFENDDATVLDRIELETGNEFPDTFRVESRPGREHFYFLQNESSRRMGNLAQGFVYHGDFSVRQNKQFCVGPGSLHPVTGQPYKIISDTEITKAPEWFVAWLLDQKIQPKKATAPTTGADAAIPSGQRNATLASIAGKFRANGASHEIILAHLKETNATRCNPPLSEKEVDVIAESIARYKVGSADPIFLGGKPLDESTTPVQTMAPSAPAVAPVVRVNAPLLAYPEFPRWTMEGTCLYEDFAKPICDLNPSRCPEFMWWPAVTLLLNYISGRVRLEYKSFPLSLFSVLIAPPHRIHKSSSVEDAMDFFKNMEFLSHEKIARPGEAKSIVFGPGSTEGLGIKMEQLHCEKAFLYYDEFSKVVRKATIEASSLATDLLTLYEAGEFANGIKSTKQSFHHSKGSYCAGFTACTTEEVFEEAWPKLGETKKTGLWDRFFFLLAPKKINPAVPQRIIPTSWARTKSLIDRAMSQQVYRVPSSSLLNELAARNARLEIQAEKLALAFAIMLDKPDIDEDCIRRACAIAGEYGPAAKRYLNIQDASTREGQIQGRMIRLLLKNDCNMLASAFKREIRPDKLGTSLFNQSFNGLLKNHYIAVTGTGVKGDEERVVLTDCPYNLEDENE